jgi:hypothetical protein
MKVVWRKLYMDLGMLDSNLSLGDSWSLMEFFVPGLRVNFLSVSALEDVRYCVLFKREHVFIYRQGVYPIELQLIGNQVDRLYMLRGQPSVYDSASNEECEETSETAVVPRIQSCISREESESLMSSGRRLSQVD